MQCSVRLALRKTSECFGHDILSFGSHGLGLRGFRSITDHCSSIMSSASGLCDRLAVTGSYTTQAERTQQHTSMLSATEFLGGHQLLTRLGMGSWLVFRGPFRRLQSRRAQEAPSKPVFEHRVSGFSGEAAVGRTKSVNQAFWTPAPLSARLDAVMKAKIGALAGSPAEAF